MQELSASKDITVRFNEVDSMNIVWHGVYSQYFEDARAAFGEKYGLSYLTIYGHGYYAPLVDLSFQFKSPLRFGEKARVDAYFQNTDAAKVIFRYEIYALSDGRLVASGKSTQVFLDLDYQLMWTTPSFFTEWKQKHLTA